MRIVINGFGACLCMPKTACSFKAGNDNCSTRKLENAFSFFNPHPGIQGHVVTQPIQSLAQIKIFGLEITKSPSVCDSGSVQFSDKEGGNKTSA